jgi:predicted acylesterase/phospholipase RssA
MLGVLHELDSPISVGAVRDARIVWIPDAEAKDLLEEIPLWKRRLIDTIGGWQGAEHGQPRVVPRYVALLHASPDSVPLVRTAAQRLEQIGESVAILTDTYAELAGATANVQSVLQEDGQLLPNEEIRGMIRDAQDHDRIILSFYVSNASDNLFRICEGTERVYWFVTPEYANEIEADIAQIVAADSSVAGHLRWVWCLSEQDTVAPLRPALKRLVRRDIKLFLPPDETPSTRWEKRGIAQLVHDLRDVRLGIALSGGAARGMAHLGTLQALDEAGIVVDAISGTSVGAMVGVLYAAGIPPLEAAEHFARDLTPGLLEQKLPGGGLFYLLRKYRRRKWDTMLRPYLHSWQLEQLLTPVSTVSVDLVAGQQVVQEQGDAVQSILGSINLPGLSPPLCRDGMALVDGGVLNNLPADVLISQGTDYVIAVDVGSHLPEEFSGNRPDTATHMMKAPNTLETLTRAFSVQSNQMNRFGAQPADFRFDPNVSAFSPAEFEHAVDIARVGHRATEPRIEELRQALTKVDASLTQ